MRACAKPLIRSLLLALMLVSAACGSRARDGEPSESREPSTEVAAKQTAAPTPPADALVSENGLISVVLGQGSGEQRPTISDAVRVRFTAWNEKGKLVDSSDQRGGPVTFEVSGVIEGWVEALQQMRVGEHRRIWVPDALSYPGRPGFPRGMSVFDIELLEIVPPPPAPPAPLDVAAPPADAIALGGGLAYTLLSPSTGEDKPKPWDRVRVHLSGWTRDGELVETTRRLEQPGTLDLAAAMPGLRQVLVVLSRGERARVWIPEALTDALPDVFTEAQRTGKPHAALTYDVELLAIERKPEPPRAPADLAAPPRTAKKTRSGLVYRVVHSGSAQSSGSQRKPSVSDRVEVHYAAWTPEGTLFDSSYARGKPTTVPLARLIPGWAEGLQLMAEGDRATLWIPESLAYGGKPGAPRGMLVYDVELIRIVR